MSDEGRRIFPLETVLDVISNKSGNNVLDFLGFALQREICETCRGAVVPVVKGWLNSMNPLFMQLSCPGDKALGVWVTEAKLKLGDNVSLEAMPVEESKGINALLDTMQSLKSTADEKIAEVAATLAMFAEAEPFKAKAETLEKQVAALEEKGKSLNEEVSTLKSELAAFSGKIAINGNEIEQSVKDMVAKAVKEALATLPVGAAGAGTAVAFEENAAPAEAEDTVPDSFGFGASGSNGDGFGF